MISSPGYGILINEAFEAFRKKRFSEAVVLLEKVVPNNPKDPYPFFLLCVSYLLCNKFGEADIMIQKTRSAGPDFIPLKQLEIFLLIKSAGNLQDVIAANIEKLEQHPEDKLLKKSLILLRKVKNFNSFQKKARLTDFVFIPNPKISKSLKKNNTTTAGTLRNTTYEPNNTGKRSANILKKILIIFIILIVTALLLSTAYYFYFVKKITTIDSNNTHLPIDSVNIDVLQYELIDKILKEKPPVFYYSNDEVIKEFNTAKILIKNEKFNEALIIINQIANSNANYRVKERNEFLRKYISTVEFKKYDSVPFNLVFQKPYLYKGSFIRWKGKIANLKGNDKKMQFNLLIDYAKEDRFSGVVDVYSGKLYKDLKNGDIVTIEGVFVNTIGSLNRLYLTADRIIKLED